MYHYYSFGRTALGVPAYLHIPLAVLSVLEEFLFVQLLMVIYIFDHRADGTVPCVVSLVSW